MILMLYFFFSSCFINFIFLHIIYKWSYICFTCILPCKLVTCLLHILISLVFLVHRLLCSFDILFQYKFRLKANCTNPTKFCVPCPFLMRIKMIKMSENCLANKCCFIVFMIKKNHVFSIKAN